MKRCTVVITHYVPSGFAHRPDRVETQLLDLHYKGLYPNPSEIRATETNTECYHKLGNLDSHEISMMLMNGHTSRTVSDGYEGRKYHTNFMIVKRY